VPVASGLGGFRGLGPVEVEPDEPVFHSGWEGRTFGIANAMIGKGLFSVDEFRYAQERMHPVAYVSALYYGRWVWGTERILIERGVLSEDEIDARMRELALHPETPTPRREEPEFAEGLLGAFYAGVSRRREIDSPRRFAVGDRVVARGAGAEGHTRLPAYARGRVGTVVRCHDAFVFPDSNADRAGENPQWCYCVHFEADELWGDAGESRASVLVELWESYLEPG
jgi:nitrile hydratase beta subunit